MFPSLFRVLALTAVLDVVVFASLRLYAIWNHNVKIGVVVFVLHVFPLVLDMVRRQDARAGFRIIDTYLNLSFASADLSNQCIRHPCNPGDSWMFHRGFTCILRVRAS